MLNDNFRSTFIGGQVVLSAGVADLPLGVRAQVVLKVQNFADFNADNDPYGEHDFGSIVWYQEKTYWKIDYYDQALQYWQDPLSPDCRRVLTVLLAREY